MGGVVISPVTLLLIMFLAALPPVWSPDRLSTLIPAAQRTGIVIQVYTEPDGDGHIWMQLNGPARILAEVTCVRPPVRPPAAVAACQGYTNTITLPQIGQRIRVFGPLVFDRDHGWLELHPVTRIDVLPP